MPVSSGRSASAVRTRSPQTRSRLRVVGQQRVLVAAAAAAAAAEADVLIDDTGTCARRARFGSVCGGCARRPPAPTTLRSCERLEADERLRVVDAAAAADEPADALDRRIGEHRACGTPRSSAASPGTTVPSSPRMKPPSCPVSWLRQEALRRGDVEVHVERHHAEQQADDQRRVLQRPAERCGRSRAAAAPNARVADALPQVRLARARGRAASARTASASASARRTARSGSPPPA